MIGCKALALAGAMALASGAWGQDLDYRLFRTGNDLDRICAGSPEQLAACEAYVVGFLDAAFYFDRSDQVVCLPPRGTGAQMHELVLAYLRAHPERRRLPAAESVMAAVQAAFPCARPREGELTWASDAHEIPP